MGSRAIGWTTIGIAAAAAWVTACGGGFPYRLRAATAGQVGCQPDEIEIKDSAGGHGVRTWTAVCQGQRYACSATTIMITTQVSCSAGGGRGREEAFDPVAAGVGTGAGYAAPASPRAQVERGFQASTNTRYVRGIFGLPGGLRAVVVGAPQVAMGRISIVLEGHTTSPDLIACKGFDVLVNAVPTASDENAAQSEAQKLKLESRFDATVFEPLRGSYPEFGVSACGVAFRFAPPQVEELRKFLVMYSELAQEVSAKSATSPAPAASSPTSL